MPCSPVPCSRRHTRFTLGIVTILLSLTRDTFSFSLLCAATPYILTPLAHLTHTHTHTRIHTPCTMYTPVAREARSTQHVIRFSTLNFTLLVSSIWRLDKPVYVLWPIVCVVALRRQVAHGGAHGQMDSQPANVCCG